MRRDRWFSHDSRTIPFFYHLLNSSNRFKSEEKIKMKKREKIMIPAVFLATFFSFQCVAFRSSFPLILNHVKPLHRNLGSASHYHRNMRGMHSFRAMHYTDEVPEYAQTSWNNQGDQSVQVETAALSEIESVKPASFEPWYSFRQVFSPSFMSHKVLSALAAFVVLASILLTPLQNALAAPTGGRMGGSFGGQSSSRQQSTPRYSAPSYSRGFSSGYSAGYYSRPSVTISPWVSPWGWGGGYYSPFFNPFWSSPRGVIVSTGPSIFDIIAFGVFGFVFFAVASSVFQSTTRSDTTFFTPSSSSALGPGVTVAEISVAVNVPRRDDPGSILNFLRRLSQTAKTDSRVGVANLVSQVALELLRQRRSIVSANTYYNHYRDGDRALREYNSIVIRERSKFERETLNKYGGVDYTSNVGGDYRLPGPSRATLAVITLIVAIDGDSTKLPKINSFSDVEKGLTVLATDVKTDDCLRSAEILWTPEDSNDVLTEYDVAADYPMLRNV